MCYVFLCVYELFIYLFFLHVENGDGIFFIFLYLLFLLRLMMVMFWLMCCGCYSNQIPCYSWSCGGKVVDFFFFSW